MSRLGLTHHSSSFFRSCGGLRLHEQGFIYRFWPWAGIGKVFLGRMRQAGITDLGFGLKSVMGGEGQKLPKVALG
jgi:hypothetical protein